MAKKEPTRDEMRQAHSMGRRLLLTMQFIEDRYGPIGMSSEYRAMIQQAMDQGNRRDLRLLSTDFTEMATGLTRDEREGLEAVLRRDLGVDVDAERAELSRQVARSVARGRIASEKERLRLVHYVETLERTDGDPAELAAVRALLERQ
jgi:hypothetical protein